MKVSLMPIASITPYARNPRKIENTKAVAKVKASLQEFGWQQPIVVDKDNVIVVGHTRYMAAMELGMTDVPVHVADKLSKTQIKAYRIADNKTATFSSWDMELLGLEFEELKDEGFDLELTGFDESEFAGLDLEDDGNNEIESPDDFKEVDENIATEHTCPKCGYAWSGGA